MLSRSRSSLLLLSLSGLLAMSTAGAQAPQARTDTAVTVTTTDQPRASEARPSLLKRVALKTATVAVIGTSKMLQGVAAVSHSAASAVDASACSGPYASASQCARYVRSEIDKPDNRPDNRPSTPVAVIVVQPITPPQLE